MKLVGIFIGLIVGGVNGLFIGFFSGHIARDILICSIFVAIFALIFFKGYVEEGLEINLDVQDEFDKKLDNKNSKIIISNSWVFMVANFLAAVIACSIEGLSTFSAFICTGFSVPSSLLIAGWLSMVFKSR
jgi:ABC-type uncharacterized transport system permease subunit